jgi:quercetin dioxygenase-like cupin family protein
METKKDRAKYAAPGEGKTLWVAGDLVTFKIVGEDTNGAYSLFEVESNPGGGPPPHVHRREDEIFCVLEGEHEVSIGERTVRASAGSVVYGPRNVPHAYKNVGATPGRILGFVAPAGIEGFFEEVGEEAKDPSTPPPFGQREVERLLAAAPKYGIEMQLPASKTGRSGTS